MWQVFRSASLLVVFWFVRVSAEETEGCIADDERTALLQKSGVEVLAHSSGMMEATIAHSTEEVGDNLFRYSQFPTHRENSSDNGSTKTRNSERVTNGTVTKEAETEKNSGEVVSKKEKVTITDETDAKANATKQNKSTPERNGKPFVHVNQTRVEVSTNTMRGKQRITVETTELTIAQPVDVVKVHLLFFLPLLVLWAIYYHVGRRQSIYQVILPITLCVMMVTQDLVNQSLAMVTRAPLGITAAQASFMVIVTGGWSACLDRHAIKASEPWMYSRWSVVAALFTVYQLVNHLVSFRCSLSERTVFNNLCPVVTIVMEYFIMPGGLKPNVSRPVKLSLALLVFGALLFSFSSPDFTAQGVSAALLMVGATVPYRLTQRGLLSDGKLSSIAFLAFIDGVLVFVVSLVAALLMNKHFAEDLIFWFKHPSILLMLVLSAMTFTGGHLCGLALLRNSSATAFVVFQSVASFIEVALGILFFGDEVFGTPLACIGLGLSLASGLWYSTEVCAQSKIFAEIRVDRASSAP